jgi:hypothetical protein
MRKLTRTPLALHRETVRYLETVALGRVAGGKFITAVSMHPECESVDACPTTTCPQSHVICTEA